MVKAIEEDDYDPTQGAGPVDPYAPSEPTGPGVCSPTVKPGVKLFRRWVTERWGEHPGSPENILRDCKVGGPSEHWEGRAWDWMIPSPEAAQAFLGELLATSAEGEPHAIARRAGVMYLIYNRRMWRAYPHLGAPSGSWSAYTGPNPHTDHVHLSFSRAGANGTTSFYPWLSRTMGERVA